MAATQLVYDKVTKMSLSALHGNLTTGTILNAASNDTQRLVNFSIYTNFLWLGFVEVAIALAMLYREVGVAALAGVGLMILLMPVQIMFARRVGQLQASAVAFTDKRTRAMGEILKSVLLVKLNVYEESFAGAVADVRKKEIKQLFKSNYAQVCCLPCRAPAPPRRLGTAQ